MPCETRLDSFRRAQAVKLEDGETVAEKVRHIVASSIPVMGHLRYTPQSTYQFMVLGLVPAPFGIGAGKHIGSGDYLLGLWADFHAQQYARLADIIKSAIAEYLAEVKAGTSQHTMDEDTELT